MIIMINDLDSNFMMCSTPAEGGFNNPTHFMKPTFTLITNDHNYHHTLGFWQVKYNNVMAVYIRPAAGRILCRYLSGINIVNWARPFGIGLMVIKRFVT